MKNVIKALMLFVVITLGGMTASAQIIVRVRPARPTVVVTRPPAPGPHHVWVDEEWRENGHGGYAWHGGYWAAPPREHAVYVPGHWNRRHGGEFWVTGHWR